MEYLNEPGQRILDSWQFLLKPVVQALTPLKTQAKWLQNRTQLEQGLSQIQNDKALGKLPVKPGETITNFPKAWYSTSVAFGLSNTKQNPLPKADALVKSKLVCLPIYSYDAQLEKLSPITKKKKIKHTTLYCF